VTPHKSLQEWIDGERALTSERLARLKATARRGILEPYASVGKFFGGAFDFEGHAEFSCSACGERVERKLKCVRGTPFVFVFLGCDCGCVVHYQGDPAPENALHWQAAVRKMRQTNSDLLMLNLNPNDDTAVGLN
jgi:hypothetical protein